MEPHFLEKAVPIALAGLKNQKFCPYVHKFICVIFFFLRTGSSLGDAAFYGQFLQGKFICDATGAVPGSNFHFFPSISLSSLQLHCN